MSAIPVSAAPDKVKIPREIWVLIASAFVIALGFGLILPVLPQFAQSFGVGATASSIVVSAFAFFRLVFAPVGGRLIAFLHTGQVMTRQPTKARFSRVAETLLQWGSEVDLKKAEDAWFSTRVLSEKQYAALVKLLVIFSKHLAACGQLLIEEGKPQEPESITKARSFITERSADDLSLGAVARVANMSANYFSEKFKEITGIRFVEYVARTRVEKACCLLQDPMHPVTNVAYDVGFHSLSQFNRAFRQFTGQSPSGYRASLKEAR